MRSGRHRGPDRAALAQQGEVCRPLRGARFHPRRRQLLEETQRRKLPREPRHQQQRHPHACRNRHRRGAFSSSFLLRLSAAGKFDAPALRTQVAQSVITNGGDGESEYAHHQVEAKPLVEILRGVGQEPVEGIHDAAQHAEETGTERHPSCPPLEFPHANACGNHDCTRRGSARATRSNPAAHAAIVHRPQSATSRRRGGSRA